MDSSFDNDNTDANIYSLYVTRINIRFMHTTNNNLYKKLYLYTHIANKPCPKDIRAARTLCILKIMLQYKRFVEFVYSQ